MAVGSSGQYNVKAELYNFENGSWKTVDDYPYSIGGAFYSYEMVFLPETKSFFAIGGATRGNAKDLVPHIAKLTNGPLAMDQWQW